MGLTLGEIRVRPTLCPTLQDFSRFLIWFLFSLILLNMKTVMFYCKVTRVYHSAEESALFTSLKVPFSFWHSSEFHSGSKLKSQFCILLQLPTMGFIALSFFCHVFFDHIVFKSVKRRISNRCTLNIFYHICVQHTGCLFSTVNSNKYDSWTSIMHSISLTCPWSVMLDFFFLCDINK